MKHILSIFLLSICLVLPTQESFAGNGKQLENFFFAQNTTKTHNTNDEHENVSHNENEHTADSHAEHADEGHGAHAMPAMWSVIPFVLLLLMIATGPLFYAHFWHKYYPHVAFVLGALIVAYYQFVLHSTGHIVHSFFEYFSFISLLTALFVASGGILINIDKNLHIDIDQTQAIGLILNELITNSYKHAFKDKINNAVSIKISVDDKTVSFNYKDNGVGFNINKIDKKSTIGINVIERLVNQLGTDAFIDAVKNDDSWNLVHEAEPAIDNGLGTDFEGKYIYEVVSAKELWDTIMDSTYNYAEPGVLFVDTINRRNNAYFDETVSCTNPCVAGDTPILTEEGWKDIDKCLAVTLLRNVKSCPTPSLAIAF